LFAGAPSARIPAVRTSRCFVTQVLHRIHFMAGLPLARSAVTLGMAIGNSSDVPGSREMTSQQEKCDSFIKVFRTLREESRQAELLLGALLVAYAVLLLVCGSLFLGKRLKPRPPRYWTRGRCCISDDYEAEVDVTSEVGVAVQLLLNASTFSKAIGRGRDAEGLTHKALKVLRVTRIENGRQWTRYKQVKKRIPKVNVLLRRMPPDLRARTLDALDIISRKNQKLLAEPHVMEFLNSLKLDSSRNEQLMFHGCPGAGARNQNGVVKFQTESESPVHAVKRQGFDDRLGNVAGMYGSGTYFADMASKADQYSGRYNEPDDPAGSIGERATMFLARVTLGCPFLTNQSLEQLRRPPCIEGHFDLNLSWNNDVKMGRPWLEKGVPFQICEHPRFDSVMGDLVIEGKRKIYREYVVYEKQSYPEFCVLYERVV